MAGLFPSQHINWGSIDPTEPVRFESLQWRTLKQASAQLSINNYNRLLTAQHFERLPVFVLFSFFVFCLFVVFFLLLQEYSYEKYTNRKDPLFVSVVSMGQFLPFSPGYELLSLLHKTGQQANQTSAGLATNIERQVNNRLPAAAPPLSPARVKSQSRRRIPVRPQVSK